MEQHREFASHPDLAELELVRTGEAVPKIAEHVRSCALCQKELAALTALAGRLERPTAPRGAFPQAADSAIRDAIRARAAVIRSERRVVRLVRRPLQVAAAAALFLAVGWWVARLAGTGSAVQQKPEPGRLLAQDIDRSGSGDIVDAYLLARGLQQDAPRPAAWDVNGDGAVDRRDVDAVAHAAVAIRPGGV